VIGGFPERRGSFYRKRNDLRVVAAQKERAKAARFFSPVIHKKTALRRFIFWNERNDLQGLSDSAV